MNQLRKRIGLYTGFALALCVLVVFALNSTVRGQEPSLPFTALYNETSTDPTTGHTAQKQNLYWALRSDGAISTGWLDDRHGQRNIRDIRGMRDVTLSDFHKLKTTVDFSNLGIAIPSRSKLSDCRPDATVSFLGTGRVEGYDTFRYQRITPLGDGRVEATEWYAPGLGCWCIQAEGRRYDSEGTLTGLFVKKTTRVLPGDPDGSFFDVPDEYAETTPSDREKTVLLQSVKDREGSSGSADFRISPAVQSLLESQDDVYNAMKK